MEPDANVQPEPKLDPASFAIRAEPHPVTRLSRRTLVIATAVMTASLIGALWWALGFNQFRLVSGKELYNTDAKPSDALSALSGSYADLTKPKQSAPPLGAPLPGDLGKPMLQQGYGGPQGSQTDAAEQAREHERQQAAGSSVLFSVSARQATPTAGSAGEGTGVALPASTTDASRPLDSDTGQNLQDRKQAFVDAKADTAIYSPQRLETPRSPYQLMAGTVMSAALVTGLNSDLPGQVIAKVTEDIFDSVSGKTLLVPQGSRLLGKYDAIVAYGQSRVLLIWTRLIMPDGSSIVLDNLPAADTEGYAGLEDGVDYHTWRLLRGIALSTLLGVGSELATDSETTGTGQGNVTVAVRQAGDNSANEAGQRIVSKDLNVQPTLTIRPGFPVRVIVRRDLVLKPFQR